MTPDFHFSQASLQDYVDCPRRFWLRCVQDVRWPAPEAGAELENERRARLGEAFHRLTHQHLLGLPEEDLARMAAADADLQRWWRSYLTHGPSLPAATRYPETTLSAPLGGYRLTATYDLVAVSADGRAVIVDWKTSARRPRREHLAGRLQTRVYPYTLARAGAQVNAGRALAPEQIEMIYWFPEHPAAPERFAYDAAQFRADERYLSALIAEIASLAEEEFHLTDDEARCRYCRYASLCGREGGGAPPEEFALSDEEGAPATAYDLGAFDQIAEVEF